MKITLNDYPKLLLKVQQTIKKTEQNIVQTVNREKVVMSWQIGKIIDQHLLKNNRAEYGKKLFEQLAKDTQIKERALYQMRSFYRTYPTLPKDESDLSWSHYRTLASVTNDEKRKYLEDLTVKNNLEANDLQHEIAKSKPRKKKTSKLAITRGQLFTYKLATFPDSNESYIDCGFNIFSEIKTKFTGEGVFQSVKKGMGFALKKSDLDSKQLHTYKAYLDRVVDGDTVHVTLDLGFKIKHKEILRLAKIAAPELATEAGKESCEALQRILKNVPFLVIKTNKTDIYGRYVADVFLGWEGEEDPQKVAEEGVYLNQQLLDLGVVEVY